MARGQFSRKDYLVASLGKWRQKVTESHPNAMPRVNEKGTHVWELVWDYVTGILKKIYIEHHPEFGGKWCLQIHDGSEVMILQISSGTGASGATIGKLLNCDLKVPITFIPYYFEEEKRARMVLEQNGQKIASYYSKDDPKDFPPFPESGTKDDLALWKIQISKFYEKVVEERIIPKLPDPAEVDNEIALAEATEPVPGKQMAKPPVEGGGPPERGEGFPDGEDGPNDLPF